MHGAMISATISVDKRNEILVMHSYANVISNGDDMIAWGDSRRDERTLAKTQTTTKNKNVAEVDVAHV